MQALALTPGERDVVLWVLNRALQDGTLAAAERAAIRAVLHKAGALTGAADAPASSQPKGRP